VLHNRDARAPADVADVEHAADDVLDALADAGHDARRFPVEAHEPIAALAGAIDAMRAADIDLVFNLCESVGGRTRHEPVVPHLLELAGMPYTGSGPLGLGLALRKDRARVVLAGAGVPIAAGVVYEAPPRRAPPLAFPLIAKLAAEDASTGIDRGSVVHDLATLTRRVAVLLARFPGPVLVEEFIAGREIYVSLVGGAPTVLPPHEIDFAKMPADCPAIVTYAGKWEPGSVEDLGSRPTRATKLGPLATVLPQLAVRAFRALDLRDYARVDFRVDVHGVPHVIDVNPNCDLSAGAGIARAAGFARWTHTQLIDKICQSAWARFGDDLPRVQRRMPPKHSTMLRQKAR
jgi:D-alanine-D-alanine ligase